MPKRVVIFVEGKADVAAVPTLAERIVQKVEARDALFVDREPFRVNGVGRLVKENCLAWHRWLDAAGKTRSNIGAILLVLDGDVERVPVAWHSYQERYRSQEFCAYRVAVMLGEEARASRAGDAFSLATVFAMKEFESWIIAGIEGLRGISLPDRRGTVSQDAGFPNIDIEVRRDAKSALRRIIPAYSQTLDQSALAARIDLDLALRRSRSFRRFENAVRQLANAVRNGVATVSPAKESES